MSFFDSEVVRAEMAEISELQEEIYGSVFNFHRMSKEDRISSSAQLMGLPSGIDMNIIFNNMTKMLDKMKSEIDKAE
jgi:hypothetical protein